MKLRLFLNTFIFSLLVSCNSSGGDSDIQNSAPTASSVTITDDNGGEAVVGDSLKGNYIYADEDNDAEGLSRYSWLRNGATIGGETASTYTLISADNGQSITFKVTPVAVTGSTIGSAVSSADITVFNFAPTVSNVNITDDNGGDIEVGDDLIGSYTYSDVESDIEGVSTYRWLRNNIAINGSTESTYTLTPSDIGLNITFELTPVATTGTLIGSPIISSSVNTEKVMISHKNFSLLASDLQPTVIDPVTGIFTKTDVTMTILIGDRNNQIISDSHTVFFIAEYGLIEPSCVTVNGSCDVTWSAIKRPDPGGPGADMRVTIIAYTIGEESFTDTNGNALFDDADGVFDDLEEPYVDADESSTYTAGDLIVDAVNGNDVTGINGAHDIGDTFFNGPGCTHSSLCSGVVITNGTIWNANTLKIDGP